MAIYRKRICPVCNGRGFISHVEDNGAWSEPCKTCSSKGQIDLPITNSERMAELHTPEEQLRFIRGFLRTTKYSDRPRRLLSDESDEDMLLWLRKISEDIDDDIFDNR